MRSGPIVASRAHMRLFTGEQLAHVADGNYPVFQNATGVCMLTTRALRFGIASLVVDILVSRQEAGSQFDARRARGRLV